MNLVSNFSGFKGIISITFDCWTGSNNMGYICVTSHFINENWNLEKKNYLHFVN